MQRKLFLEQAEKGQRYYAPVPHQKLPFCLLNNGQKLNNHRGGIC